MYIPVVYFYRSIVFFFNTILSILKIGLILALIYLLIYFLEGAQCAATVVKGLGAVMLAKGYRFCL